MKRLLLIAILIITCCRLGFSQESKVDSLQKAYSKNKQDTTLVQFLVEKSVTVYLNTNPDSGLLSLRKGLILSQKIHYKKGEVEAQASIGSFLQRGGDLPGSMQICFNVIPQAIQISDWKIVIGCYNILGLDNATLKDYKKAFYYMFKAKNLAEKHNDNFELVMYNNIAREYIDINNPDSAFYYTQKGFDFAKKKHLDKNVPYLIRNLGIIQFEKGNNAKAIDFYNKSLQVLSNTKNYYLYSENYRRIGEVYQRMNIPDPCIIYAKKAYDAAILGRNSELVMKAATLLKNSYKATANFKEAYNYQQIMINAQDSLFSQQKTLQIQNLTFNQQQHDRDIEDAKIASQNKLRMYLLGGVLGVVILIAFILLYNNRLKKKANYVLHQRNEQIDTQRKALEKTLSELKVTQTQLIQSEKMASLGELTAGIAHEIQNPLNFINNFSEVNAELIDEMQQEIDNGNFNEAKTIANDVRDNQQKISQHGKRADFIVKGMLQHSRISTGEKQETNINVLADEFFKLSYHGLRAKDKSFNAEMITHFDKRLPKANIVQQDFGRVLLNLFNNAFYAVNQKKRTAGNNYKPEVTVSTFIPSAGGWGVKVKDNGNGIPDAVKDKIMQPFFTTKPTGEGTGLGLSLSYDIVVKGHGGKIDVDSKEGEGSEFIITLSKS